MTATSPLLSVGTFGVHLVEFSNGWAFVGTVPSSIKRGGFNSFDEGVAAFVSWFKSQDLAFQREHISDLRTDVFCLVLAA